MTKQVCPLCEKEPLRGSPGVCLRCRDTLEHAIANIGAYHADLATIRTGQTRYGNAGGGPSTGTAESPLGMDTRFARKGQGTRLLADTRTNVAHWARRLHLHRTAYAGPICPDQIRPPLTLARDKPCDHDTCARLRKVRAIRGPIITRVDPLQAAAGDPTVPSCLRYLLSHVDQLRRLPDAVAAVEVFASLERRLSRIVDRPPDRFYAGVCMADLSNPDEPDAIVRECGQTLWAKTDAGDIECQACGTIHDVKVRRQWLMDGARDYVLAATECARAITLLADYQGTSNKLADRIRQWNARGKISLADKAVEVVNGRPTMVYRLGAILDLVAGDLRHDGSTAALGPVCGVCQHESCVSLRRSRERRTQPIRVEKVSA